MLAPHARLEHEAHFFAEMLRYSRLVLLYGEPGCGKTELLKNGLLPLFDRGESASLPAERVVYFGAWNETPLEALSTEIERSLSSGTSGVAGLASRMGSAWVERLSAWTTESGQTLLVILDHFERFLALPAGLRRAEFEQAWIAALAAPDLRVNFLVALRADAEPLMMERFQHRVATLGDNRLVLPPLHRRHPAEEKVAAPAAAPTTSGPEEGGSETSLASVASVASAEPTAQRDIDDDEVAVHGQTAMPYASASGVFPLVPASAAVTEAALSPPVRVQARYRQLRRVTAVRAALFAGVALVVSAFIAWLWHEEPASPMQRLAQGNVVPPLLLSETGTPAGASALGSALTRELGLVLAVAQGGGAKAIGDGVASTRAASSKDTDLLVVRYDVLDALRDQPDAATRDLDSLRLLAPLQVDPFYFVVRRDDRSEYLHEVAARRVNVGAGGSDAALGAMHLFQRMFGAPLNTASFLSDADALDALVRDRSVDVVVLFGPTGLSALLAQQRASPNAFRLLALDRNNAASRRALRAYLPIEIPPSDQAPFLARSLSTLGVMSFLVTRHDQDEKAGRIVRVLCDHLPYLRQLGHPYWRQVGPAPVFTAGWRYAAAAERELRSCEARRSSSPEKIDAGLSPGPTISRLETPGGPSR